MPKKPKPPDPDRLVRDQPGLYRSEDGRFTVRSDAAGAWYVGDGERTNELGLDLVLGPLATLAEAREAVRQQRDAPTGQTAEEAAAVAAKALPLPERKAGRAKASKPENGAKAVGKTTAPARIEPEPAAEPEPAKPAVRRARRRRTGDARDEVIDALVRINDAWLEGRPHDMAEDLDERVVFVEAGFANRREGRKRAIERYRDLVHSAVLVAWSESDLEVDIWGDTAIATCRYEFEWEARTPPNHERGSDLFVFRHVGNRWLVVFRLETRES